MKLSILLLSLFISLTALAETQDFECVGDLTKDYYSRRTHLTFNDETKLLEGYVGSLETGGILFEAKQDNDKMILKMWRNETGVETEIARSSLPLDSEMRMSIGLEEGYEASMLCFKK